MPVTTDFADENIEVGEDKPVRVTPREEDGSAMVPSTLELEVTDPDGDSTIYQLGDFDKNGDTYEIYVTLDKPKRWHLEVTATDSNGHDEKVSWAPYVHR